MRPHRIRSPRRGGSPRRPGPPVRRGAARGGGRGLNLVEIVLVIAILSLLSAIAVPRYGNSIMRYRAESAARRVAQDLALAQAHAANAGRPQAVVFVARGYQMPGMPHLNGKGYGDYTVDLGTDAYAVTRVAAEFGGDGKVTFDLYGAPDTGGSVVVEVGDIRRVVVLHPDTGKVQIK